MPLALLRDRERQLHGEVADSGGGAALFHAAPAVRSYIGHPDTVTLLARLLGAPIQYKRGLFSHEVGQRALCVKLRGRVPEGRELGAAEIEEIGFDFTLLVRTA